MKRFRFSLQKILQLREFVERQAEIDLAKAIAEGDRLKLELEQVAQKRFQSNKDRSAADFNTLIVLEHFITKLDIRKEELLEEIAAAELVIEQKRLVMNEAMRERKVISKLKEKKELEFRKQRMQQEDVDMDDIVGPSYTAELHAVERN